MFIEYLNAKAEREGATYPDLKVEDILLVDKFILDDIDLFTEETKVERPTNFFERKVTSHENECEKNNDFDIDFHIMYYFFKQTLFYIIIRVQYGRVQIRKTSNTF